MPKNDKKSENKQKDIRKYWYFAQLSYKYASHDANGVFNGLTEQEWINRIFNLLKYDNPAIKAEFIAFIFHDYIQGASSPEMHVHALIKLKHGYSKTQTAMMAALGITRAENCVVARDPVDCARYMIHVSESALNAKKKIYPVENVCISQEPDGMMQFIDLMVRQKPKKLRKSKKTQEEEQEKAEKEIKQEIEAIKEEARGALLDLYSARLARGEMILSEVEFAIRSDAPGLGFEQLHWDKSRRRFEQSLEDYKKHRVEFYNSYDLDGNPRFRCLSMIYLQAGGGVGKGDLGVALGKLWADKRGIHRVAAPGKKTTFDFAGNYRGEKFTIFNESPASAFNVDQFCSIFDPKIPETVNSRNVDKPWFANYCLFTSAVGFEQFIEDMWTPYAITKTHSARLHEQLQDLDVADKIRQIRRRFCVMVRHKPATGELEIYVRTEAHNPPAPLTYDYLQSKYRNEVPFIPYALVPYDYRDAGQVRNAAEWIDKAVNYYYELNNFTKINPLVPDGFDDWISEKILLPDMPESLDKLSELEEMLSGDGQEQEQEATAETEPDYIG